MSMTKKMLCIILFALMMCTTNSISVFAKEEMKFFFELSADGQQEKEVNTGDILLVTLRLRRLDADEPYMVYAMQDEICYDSAFFELVEGSEILSDGIRSTDVAMVDNYRELYMNYLSMSGGTQWSHDTMIGSFQLKVIAESGVSKISSNDYLLSKQDGTGTFSCEANEITVILSTECIVRFMTNGGSKIDDQVVPYGEKIEHPTDPKRKGYKLEGWYQDIHLTEKWNFDEDVVKNNMSLYAKWIEDNDTWDVCCMFPFLIFIIIVLIILISIRWKNNKKN